MKNEDTLVVQIFGKWYPRRGANSAPIASKANALTFHYLTLQESCGVRYVIIGSRLDQGYIEAIDEGDLALSALSLSLSLSLSFLSRSL